MDIHHRITGALHIVSGVLTAAIPAALVLILGAVLGLSSSFATASEGSVLSMIMWVVTTFFMLFVLLGVAEIIAGIALLRGSATGRVFVIVFGVLHLFNFPIGTALGAYTLWALLRTPEPAVIPPPATY